MFVVGCALVLTGGCDRDERRVATTQLALEEEVVAESEVEEKLVLSAPAAQRAVDDYVAAITGPISAEAEAEAIEALRALPPSVLVGELAAAFEESSLMQRWLILFIMGKAPSAEALSFASQFLQVTVHDAYGDYMEVTGLDEPGEDVFHALKLVYQAITILSRCMEVGVPNAGDVLLAVALDHELPSVRQPAIHAIEMNGDAELAEELRLGMRPADEIWLNPTVMPHAEPVELDPDDPAFGDQDEPELPR